MLRFLLLILLSFYFFSLKAQKLNNPYFLYGNKKVKVSNANYTRYIIPQLRAMKKEYYHLLKKLHPTHESLVAIKSQLTSMKRTFGRFKKICSMRDRPECLDTVKGLYLQSRKLDMLLLEMHSDKINFENILYEREISALLSLTSSLDEIATQNYQFMHKIEEYLITVQTSFFPLFSGKSQLGPLIYKMTLASEMAQTMLLRDKLKDDFDFAWVHFFKIIEDKVLRENNGAFLLKRLEELNISWNTFNMKITKGNHNLDRSIISIIKIMHNRWNSVLKVLLRN